MRSLIQRIQTIFGVIVTVILSVMSFYLGVTGILDRVVVAPDKLKRVEVLLATSPKLFWLCISFWFAFGTALAWSIIYGNWKAIRRPSASP